MRKLLSFLIVFLVVISSHQNLSAQSYKSFKIEKADTINRIDSNNHRQGKWIERRGMVFFVGYYINNYREGVWTFYGVDERPITFEEYRHGKKNGVTLVLDEDGKLRNERHFKNDKLDGLNAFYSKNSTLLLKRYYKDGELHGDFFKYYENGEILEYSYYQYGKKDSISTFYDEKGVTVAIIHYKNGKLNGLYKTLYGNGILRSEQYYKDDVPINGFIEYHDNSRIKVKGQYFSGEKDGKWLEYDINGRKTKETVYKNGKVLKEKVY